MSRIDFAIVGGGWRAEFFLRIARTLPDQFRVVGMVVRDATKGDAITTAWGIPTHRDIDGLLKTARPSFVIVSVPQPAAPGIISELAGRGLPILTETPPAPTLDGLLDLWRLVEGGARIQVAEQYIYQPLHAARLALMRSGKLGEPTFAHVSSCHGYHGTSLIRHFLGIGFENATVTARAFESDIIAGPGRTGPATTEKTNRSRQVMAQLDFGSRLGVYDFTGDQYFSWIRYCRYCCAAAEAKSAIPLCATCRIMPRPWNWSLGVRTRASTAIWRDSGARAFWQARNGSTETRFPTLR